MIGWFVNFLTGRFGRIRDLLLTPLLVQRGLGFSWVRWPSYLNIVRSTVVPQEERDKKFQIDLLEVRVMKFA